MQQKFEKVTKATLFIGLNDQDAGVQLVETVTAVAIITDVCTRYLGGATISNATGVWQNQAEKTIRVEINRANLNDVDAVIDILKKRLNQNCILCEVSEILAAFK